jgi:hypothetical protein
MGVIPRANFKRRKTIMDIAAWIMDNWAAIVDFFDKLFEVIAKAIEK